MWLALLCMTAWAGPPPDLSDQAVRGQCEKAKTSEGARTATGADQTYVGRFAVAADGSVTGSEKRLLFANSAWKADKGEDGRAGADCVNEWVVQGQKTAVSGCPDCDFGISFQADIDYSKSTCPQQLVVDGNHYKGGYDVKVKADGTFELYFATSGKKLATGRYSDDQYSWISTHRCIWL